MILIRIIILGFIFVYIVMILFSFDPADPGWMQHIGYNELMCSNIGGKVGARIADFLFFSFGVVAYIMPLFILFYLWKFFLNKNNRPVFIFFLELIAIFIFLLICCVCAQSIMNDIFYFAPGGIIGSILLNIIKVPQYFLYYIIMNLISISIIGCMYFFNQNFLNLIAKIYKKIIYILHIIFGKSLTSISKLNYYVQKVFCCSSIMSSIYFKKKYVVYKKFFNRQSKISKLLIKNCDKSTQFVSFTNSPICNNIISSLPSAMNFGCVEWNWLNNRDQQQHINIPKSDQFKLNVDGNNQYYCSNRIKFINTLDRINYSNKNVDEKSNCYSKKIFSKNMFMLFNNNVNRNHTLFKFMNHKSDSIFHNRKNRDKTKFIKSNLQKKTLPQNNMNHYHSIIVPKKKYNDTINLGLPNKNLLISNVKKKSINSFKFEQDAELIESKLLEYRIKAKVMQITSGPVVTLFALNLSAGIKSSKISGLSLDLARSLSVRAVRVIEVIPETPYIGLEIPNKNRDIVFLEEIISSENFRNMNSPLALALGKDICGIPVIADLRNMPHLLVSGTTGSGKSMGINSMIISMLYKSTPEEVRFIMIDPKILELSVYSNIPHLLKKVITDVNDVESILQLCIIEMERRYKLMSILNVRNLENYNNQVEQSIFTQDTIENNVFCFEITKKLPYIVIIIDELSDLMILTDKKIEVLITRLTQKARAAGIHLILSTQRPSVNVITGLIKANIPARIAFTVSSKIDSRTILGQSGAESLLGKGDMLYLPANSSMLVRIHGACVQDEEICSVVKFWTTQKHY
ncbi:DNA translocase ftsK [Candidatus Blochmanniella vafra str. BVAF]|uniref:DNA translocase ftsK n=1 Tax=Blochmanniella vafra (strain BVAF) TaxID=859654 RepID=E8Q688_BLOVB|nr:DNA translocase ftsK [Candidatus Blochmannia vafer str. BVAF]